MVLLKTMNANLMAALQEKPRNHQSQQETTRAP